MNDYEFILKVGKANIDIINKIMEAYEGLGNVRTLDNTKGIIKILTLSRYESDIESVLNKIEDCFKINIEILSKGVWQGEI